MGLLERYLATLPSPCHPGLVQVAREFCVFAGERSLDRALVDSWLEKLRGKEYARGTIAWRFDVVKRLFQANGVKWPYHRGERPQVGEEDVLALSLEPPLVIALIQTSFALSAEMRGYVAMSSTYGLRRAEMAELTQRSFNFSSGLVYVETAKHGRQRYHRLPPQILPFVQEASWTQRSPDALSRLFYELRKESGIPALVRGQDIGWHALRRTLDAVLLRGGMSEAEVSVYLRWKRSGRDMARRYLTTRVIGANDVTTTPGLQDDAMDLKAFSLIPWLPTWEEYRP